MSEEALKEIMIWTNRQQVPLLQHLLTQEPSWSLIAAGGPSRAHLRHLDDEVEFPCYDDLRQMIVAHPDAMLILASTEGVQRKNLQQLIDSQIQCCCLEMPVSSIGDAKLIDQSDATSLFKLCPCFRIHPIYTAAMDPELGMEEREAMNLILLSSLGSISLYTRLCEAIDTIINTLGMPTAINASLTGPLSETDNPRCLTGHITANLSFEDSASASLLVSDRSSSYTRQITLCSTNHQLWLNDAGYTLIDQNGQEIDKQDNNQAQSIVDQIHLSYTQWASSDQHFSFTDVLACCHALILSCKTGESESPQRLASIE